MTHVQRRVLLGGALGAAAALLVDTPVAAAPKPVRDPLRRSRFTAELGQRFTLSSSSTSWTAALSRLDDLQAATPGDEKKFALVLDATKAGLGDGTYTLSRPGFAATEVFLVADPARHSWVGIVNRG